MMLFVSYAKGGPLGDSGTRSGQMEELLAPARPVRRSTGVKVIKQSFYVYQDFDDELPGSYQTANSSGCVFHEFVQTLHSPRFHNAVARVIIENNLERMTKISLTAVSLRTSNWGVYRESGAESSRDDKFSPNVNLSFRKRISYLIRYCPTSTC
ncbi:hypothetical protein RB195_021760 [Necator americanus]|uniref:Uncharacterized protein n=1 Tax=Necator americanus TaxID=51031 RepID=A0ABR1ED83_NECAM